MAMGISKILPPFFCFIFLSFLTLCSSGSQVNLSDDAKRNEGISSPTKTIWKHSVFPNQIKVLVTDYKNLKAFCDSGLLVDIVVDEVELKNHRTSTASVVSWLNTHLPCINISSIIVSSSSPDSGFGKQLVSVLDTLKSVHSALESLDLNREVKVSIAFSRPMLENSQRWHLNQIMDFIRTSNSFIVLETEINDALSMEDHFVSLMIKSATLLRYKDVPIVLSVRSSTIPTSIEFSERMMTYMKSHEHFAERISGVFVQISSMQEQEFHSSNRQLLSHNSPMEVTLHDVIQQSSLVPTIVTVPATNPVITSPVSSATNPAATPIIAPPTDPVATPLMVPPANNLAPPFVTVPVTPPTTINPTPPTVPITPPTPVVNPVTPPGTTNPPTTSGQAWCVAKTGASQSALQAGIDYACGLGGADCSAIQPSGSCYNPNNPQNHASYAFNSYYQKNPAPTSCDFKGAATLVNSNPSTGSCIYPSSSSSSSSSVSPPATPLLSSPPPVTTSPSLPTLSSPPPATISAPTTPPATTSSGLPPFMLNSSNPDSAAPTIYGTSPPPGSSVSMAASLRPLYISIILVQFVFGNLCWP